MEGGGRLAKKYYWLKLKDDWFNSKVIKKLRRIAGGDTYTIIYLKTLLLSLKNEGKLYYEGVEESFAEELALELDEDADNVNVTLSFLQSYGLLEIVDTDEYMLTEVPASIGSESASAERMRKCRANKNKRLLEKNVSQCDSVVTGGDTDIDIEIDIEKENINTLARSLGRQDSEPEADVSALAAGHVRPSLNAGAGQQSNGMQEADVEAVILNDGTEWRPTQALFAEYVRLYPNVDVKQQFNEMRAWCLSNQKKRKTRKGVKRFVNSWLSREQDRGSITGFGNETVQSSRVGKNKGSTSRFSNFHQRSYDMSQMERSLLQADGGFSESVEADGEKTK